MSWIVLTHSLSLCFSAKLQLDGVAETILKTDIKISVEILIKKKKPKTNMAKVIGLT